MADHVNIHRPDRFCEQWRQRLAYDQLKAELETMRAHRDKAMGDLEAIFNRLARGEHVELWIDPDRCMVVRTWEPKGRGWDCKLPDGIFREPVEG